MDDFFCSCSLLNVFYETRYDESESEPEPETQTEM